MSCSRSLLLVTQTLAILIGLALIGTAVFLGVNADSDDTLAFTYLLPTPTLIALYGAGGFILGLGVIGLLGVACRIRFYIILFVCFNIIAFILTVALVPYGLVYVNDVAVADDVDSFVGSVVTEWETDLALYTVAEPVKWFDAQDELKCCGVSARALFTSVETTPSTTPVQLANSMLTGSRCNASRVTLDQIVNGFVSNPENSNGTIPAAVLLLIEADEVMSGSFFFCGDLVEDVLRDFTVPIAVVMGFVAFLQLINIRASFVLVYRVHKDKGGFLRYGDDVVGGWGEARRKPSKIARLGLGSNTSSKKAAMRNSFMTSESPPLDAKAPSKVFFSPGLAPTTAPPTGTESSNSRLSSKGSSSQSRGPSIAAFNRAMNGMLQSDFFKSPRPPLSVPPMLPPRRNTEVRQAIPSQVDTFASDVESLPRTSKGPFGRSVQSIKSLGSLGTLASSASATFRGRNKRASTLSEIDV